VIKKIVAQYVERFGEEVWKEMRIIESNHPRFVVGSRFDFGFLQIASGEGYEITIKPLEDAND